MSAVNVSPIAELKWTFNSFARRHPKTTAGIAATLAAAGGFGVWSLIPTRHERLMEWRQNYTQLCFTANEKDNTLKDRDAAMRLYAADEALEKMYPYGWKASTNFNGDVNNAVYCFDELAEGEPMFQHWMIGNINIIDNDYPQADLVEPYLMNEFDHYWGATVDYMDGWGSNIPRYTGESAIMYYRFQQGINAAEKIDMMYHLQLKFDENVFASPYWQDLKTSAYYGSLAQTYETAWIKYDQVADDVTDPRVLKSTMHALMADPVKTDSADAGFLNKYAQYMRDEYTECEVVGYDEDGEEIEECWEEYESPPRYIHSVHLDPQTIVDMSALIRAGERPFLTYEDVELIMNDERYRQFGGNAQWAWNRAQGLIDDWCRWHETDNFGAHELAIDYKAVERYFEDALKHEPKNDGMITGPGF